MSASVKGRSRVRQLLVVGVLVAACLAGLGVLWATSSGSPVSADEATAFATALQEDVLAGHPEAACDVALSERMCRESLEEYRDRVPSQQARIVCTWPLEGSQAQVVVLDGIDGSGGTYVNHMPVLRDNGRLVSSSSVYWRNYGVPNVNPVTADSAGGDPEPMCK